MKALTGLEKAALLLKSLGEQTATAVLAKLSPEQAQRVRAQMADLAASPDLKQATREVFTELEQAIRDDGKAAKGPEASKPTSAASDTKKAADPKAARVDVVVKDQVAAPAAPKPLPEDALVAIRKVPADGLARALDGENPRTVSLLLNFLDVAQASEIYKKLPSALRRDVSIQFARQATPPPEVLRRIVQGVVLKAQALAQTAVVSDEDRVKKMSALLRVLERADRQETLTALSEKEPEMAKKVKDVLYQFEDLLLMDNPSCQKLLGEMDTKTLATSLKGAAAEIEQKILVNMSKRAQETLRDEIELLGNVPGAKQTLARQSVVEAIQRLDERGELTMLE